MGRGRRGGYAGKYIRKHRMNRGGPIAELKTVDLGAQLLKGDAVISAQSIAVLNGTVNGAGFNQRIGQRINMKSIQVEGFFTPNAAGIGLNDTHYYRMMLIYDAQPNKAFPALPDILQMVNAASAPSTATDGFMNMQNRDRFLMLRDKKYPLYRSVTSGAAGPHFGPPSTQEVAMFSPPPIKFKWYVKLKGLETVYADPADASITGIQTGSLLFVFLYNNGTANSPFAIDWNSRLRFYD